MVILADHVLDFPVDLLVLTCYITVTIISRL